MARLGIILAMTAETEVIEETEDEVDRLVGRIVMLGMRMLMLLVEAIETVSAKIDTEAAEIVETENGIATEARGEIVVARRFHDPLDATATCSRRDVAVAVVAAAIDGIAKGLTGCEMKISSRRTDEGVVQHPHLRSGSRRQI